MTHFNSKIRDERLKNFRVIQEVNCPQFTSIDIIRIKVICLPPGGFQNQWYNLGQVFLLTFTVIGIQFIYGSPLFWSMNHLYAAPPIQDNRDIEFAG